MKKIITFLVLIQTGIANAALLTFDDIEGGSLQNTWARVGNYQGFNFSYTLGWVDVVDSSWDYGAHSGEFGLVNASGGTGIITRENGDDFTFDGLWAKQWLTAPDSGGTHYLNGTVSGYNQGQLVWSVNSQLNGSYRFFTAQSGAIDELHLGFGDVFLVDDIALNEAEAVSNPISLLLFGAGFLGILRVRRKS